MLQEQKTKRVPLVPAETVEQKIYLIRGQKVMLDADLAELYQVTTSNLNKAVKRNMNRFPADFMFRLTAEEVQTLRFQNGTSNVKSHVATLKQNHGGRRYLPYAFTEQGVAMLSAVLKSRRAVQTSVAIIRVFVQLRRVLVSHHEILHRLSNLEQKFKKHDEEIETVFRAIRKLITTKEESVPEKRRIGFNAA